MRKSVAIARAQLIGTPENESEPAVVQIATDAPLHLLFEHKILMCPVGDPAELYFSLYNGPKNEFVSEEYVVHMTVNGMPEGIIVTHMNHCSTHFCLDLSKLGKLKTIFLDIPQRELQSGELYLVLRIVKKSKPPGTDDPKKAVRR